LREELGLDVATLAPQFGKRQLLFPMGPEWDGQHDTYFLVDADGFEPSPLPSATELLAEHVDEVRWWTLAELKAAQRVFDHTPRGQGTLTFSPRRLADLAEDLLTNGRPTEPLVLDA
jgi:hypothetical protein